MEINNYQSTTFGNFNILPKGEEYLKSQGINLAQGTLNRLKRNYSSYKWNLNLNESGFSFVSPKKKRTYTGPFTLKRKGARESSGSKNDYRLSIRMNEQNSSRFIVKYDDKRSLSNIYYKYQRSTLLEKIFILFELLEKNFIK